MKKIIIFIVLLIVFTLIMVVLAMASNKIEKEGQETNATILSNNKIKWGIKRNENHEQPDVGSENRRIIEQNSGICLGNKEKPYIYLTFDAGYEAGYTSKILDVLNQNKVKAIFFITAHYLNTQPDLVQRMLEEGHLIGNHTVNHKSMPDITDEEIKKEVMTLHQAICEKYAYEMRFIRPPKGECSERTINITNNLGYKTVMWSFAYADWDEKKQPSDEEAKQMIIKNTHNGEIILLHATSKTNADILDDVIKQIKQDGYEFKSLDEFE